MITLSVQRFMFMYMTIQPNIIDFTFYISL